MTEESLKEKTKKGLFWQFFGQFSIYGMQFIIGIILARILSPTDYGTIALPTVFMTLAQIFVDSGFTQALIRKKDLSESDLSTSFYYSFCVGLFMYLCLFLAAPYIADLYEKPILTKLLRITAITFFWTPLNTPQNVILKKKLDFKTPARISIINQIVSGILGISAAYAGFGMWALVIMSLTSSVLLFVQTWIAVKWLPSKKFSKDSFKYLWNYGNKIIGVNLLNALCSNLFPLLIGKFYSIREIGIYKKASGYASLPSSNLTGVLNNVTFPVLSKIQDDKEKFAYIYRRMIRVSSFLVFPLMMLLCALAEPLIVCLITDKWIDCVVILQIMCFTYMFQPVHSMNVNLLLIVGRTDLSLKINIIGNIISIVLILIAVRYSLVVLCIVDFFITMITLVINTYYTGKIIKVGYIRQVKDLLPSFVMSIMMMIIVVIVINFIESKVLQILVGGTVGICLYYLLARIFKFSEIEEIRYLISRKK